MELNEAIIKRRSVRKYTDYRVTDDEIRAVLEAARFAPSWANSQVWEFIVVRDPAVIRGISATFSEFNPARKHSESASALIVACAKKGVSGCKGGGEDVTKFSNWYMFDLGLAVQNLCLKAHELGLGTVIVGYLDHDKCKALLALPDEYEVVVVLPIGKPAVAGKEGPPRRELREFVHRDRFGNLMPW